MGWATVYIDKLKKGETVQFRPRGNSMKGKIDSGHKDNDFRSAIIGEESMAGLERTESTASVLESSNRFFRQLI